MSLEHLCEGCKRSYSSSDPDYCFCDKHFEEEKQASYEKGYDTGMKDGDFEGYERGYREGQKAGDSEGFERGYADGDQHGYYRGLQEPKI